MKAYLDRFEENLAVIIMEETKKQFIKPIEQLPSGSVPGTWLEVKLENDDVIEIKIDKGATAAKKETNENILSKLRAKNIGSKFKK